MADPKNLAAVFLEKTGFTQADLDLVGPILTEAAENRTLAKQLLNAPPIKTN